MSYNGGESNMWDIGGGNERDPFEWVDILEYAILSLDDKPDLEVVLFIDDGKGNDAILTVKMWYHSHVYNI